MASFDEHSKCARSQDKGVGDYPCVPKKDCHLCNILSAEQKLQIASLTYESHGEQQKKSKYPSLVNPENVKLLWKVGSGQVIQDMTPVSQRR